MLAPSPVDMFAQEVCALSHWFASPADLIPDAVSPKVSIPRETRVKGARLHCSDLSPNFLSFLKIY